MMRVSDREFVEAKMNDAVKDATQSVVKDLTAVKNEIAQLSQQIAEAVSALAAAAQSQGRRSLRHARADVDAAVSGASDSAGAVADAAQNAASSVADLAGGRDPGSAGRSSRTRAGRRLHHRRVLRR